MSAKRHKDKAALRGVEYPLRHLPLNRPLGWVAAAYTGGIALAAGGRCPNALTPVTLVAVAVMLVATERKHAWSRFVSVVVVALAAGMLQWHLRHAGPPGDELARSVARGADRALVEIEGRVRLTGMAAPDPEWTSFHVDADTISAGKGPRPIRGRVNVAWVAAGDAPPVLAGDRVRVKGRASVILGRINPGVRGWEDRTRIQGVHTVIHARGSEAVRVMKEGSWWWPPYWTSRLRLAQFESLRRAVPEDCQSFVMPIWLGWTNGRAAEIAEPYILTGTAHILAISGLHVALVFVSAGFLLRLFIRDRRIRALGITATVLLFALTAGARPSVLRAAIMLSIYMAADLFDRERDAPSALSVAALLLLTWNPDLLFDIGFQLSFLSVASLLLFGEGLFVLLGRLPRAARGVVATSLAVQVLPVPVAASAFLVIPLLTVPMNALVLPLFTGVLWLTCVASLTGLMWPSAAPIFGHALAPGVWLIRWLTQEGAFLRFLQLRVATAPAWPAIAAWYLAVACVVAAVFSARRKTWLAAAGLALTAIPLFWSPWRPRSEVVFLDVGHGDAAFIRTADGHTALIDAGDKPDARGGPRETITDFLAANDVSRLDYLVISHPDQDHIGGALAVMEHVHVQTVVMGPVASDRPAEEQVVEAGREAAVVLQRVHAGQSLVLGSARIEVLHPEPQWAKAASVNDRSLVLRLLWDGPTVLFPGDIEQAGEARLGALDCRADVLKVPHHGSRTSSSPGFIRAVSPEYAVVSTGASRGKESADATILERYSEMGIPVARTDYLGGIRLEAGTKSVISTGTRPLRGYVYPRPASQTALIDRGSP